MYAAAGLYYNFEKIEFKAQSKTTTEANNEYNMGYYTKINGETSEKLTGEIFKANIASGKIDGVRSVTLADIDNLNLAITDVNGLFTLKNYTPDVHNSGEYWLASHDPTSPIRLRYWGEDGLDDWNCGLHGVRPVISISGVTMEKDGNIWKIVE